LQNLVNNGVMVSLERGGHNPVAGGFYLRLLIDYTSCGSREGKIRGSTRPTFVDPGAVRAPSGSNPISVDSSDL
jgi:hypothetical protein